MISCRLCVLAVVVQYHVLVVNAYPKANTACTAAPNCVAFNYQGVSYAAGECSVVDNGYLDGDARYTGVTYRAWCGTIVLGNGDWDAAATTYNTCTCPSWVTAAGADPVATFGDTARMFELPPGVLTTLLETDDIRVEGSVFPGTTPSEQYFGHMVVTSKLGTADDHRFIDMKIKENLQDVNISNLAPSDFRILNVTLGFGVPGRNTLQYENLASFTSSRLPGAIVPIDYLGYDLEFQENVVFQNPDDRNSSKFYRECGETVTPTIHFAVCSSLSQKYFGDLRDVSMLDAHPYFNVGVLDVADWKVVTGLLPELWGNQVMSETTKTYVKKEQSSSDLTVADADAELAFRRDREKALAWAGGAGVHTMGHTTDAQVII
eukprot:gnl/TRDRNA2_/TRDRNA2_176876_c1_seq2.p1 gnl/TRDRNA2_/TRDRNA2_176876_c1~~gnl/TRDRNA2_/TRDRNA2_176876_c1_seq2.p1  ORF type:complete len:377 (+),score=56.53 gnl/TRDRNA2_/TRDRNA2_176876_c1_seq2:65-1195(+)